MAKYMLIESRDPFDSNEVHRFYDTAAGLAKEGNDVTLFLVQNGVLPARKCDASKPLAELDNTGVRILADEFSLRERGIHQSQLAEGVEPAPLEVVVDRMAEGHKAIWH